MFLVNLVSDTRSLQLFLKTAPCQQLAENPAQLFLYSSCLSSPLDKVEPLITFCLKHTLAMPLSNRLWFSSFSRGLQGLGQHRSDKPAASFHLLHWTLRACRPPAVPGPRALFWSTWRCKWEILLEMEKNCSLPKMFPYLYLMYVSISTPYVQNKKALVLFKLPTFPVSRLHLHLTSPRAGPFALLPKPHKLRSLRWQQKLPGNRDWRWKKEDNACVFSKTWGR